MANYGNEQRGMDAAIHDEHAGLVLQVVGWTVLFFCSIPAMFLFVGWRSGSWFWAWVTLGLGVVGLGLVGAGAFLRSRSARDFAALSGTLRSRSVSALKEEEPPPSDDVDHRAA